MKEMMKSSTRKEAKKIRSFLVVDHPVATSRKRSSTSTSTMEAGTGMVEDLASLADLNDKTLLNELYVRYHRDTIYTYIGDILIAVNPIKDIPGLYDEQQAKRYTSVAVRSKLRPHIFAIADTAYQNMKQNRATQCCVVSGESGAGKTESAKLLVKQIVELCPKTKCLSTSTDLHNKLVEVNPLMEAFGNAQTVMNDNSSRFGKYIELKFTENGAIVGGFISIFLLEKTRVISHGSGEQNFHIFYHLFAGLTDSQLKNILLTSPEQHRILKPHGGGPVFKNNVQFAHHRRVFKDLVKIMYDVGFTCEDVESIYAILSTILHISDIRFENDSETDGVYIVNEYSLEVAAELLGVSAEDLATTLISRTSIIRGEKIVTLNNLVHANDGRDAVAKSLYGRLFGWIVRQINNKLKPTDIPTTTMSTIGILDIAGFENFKHNSFEQLCINVANEQLQFYFNQHIFRWEMDDLAKEGIKGALVKFTNNANILSLFFEKPIGLYALLDEESKFPKATSTTLLDKFKKHLSKNYIRKEKGKDPLFSIQHYAGPVVYNAASMLEKNRDSLSGNILECLQQSESLLVYDLFSSQFSASGDLDVRNSQHPRKRSILMCKQPSLNRGKSLSRSAGRKVKMSMKHVIKEMQEDLSFHKTQTAGNQFMASLTDLTRKLMAGQPHFIRCIKPNKEKLPGKIDLEFVKQQLKYTGILETVRIRHEGYPIRLPFHVFLERYKFISFPLSSYIPPDATHCQAVLNQAGLYQWEIGKQKVFLKYWHSEQLRSVLLKSINQVIIAQKCARGFVARQKAKRVRQIVASKKQAQVISLLRSINQCSEHMAVYLKDCANHDISRWQQQLAATDAEEKRLRDELIAQKRNKIEQLQAEQNRKLESLRAQEDKVQQQIKKSREFQISQQTSSPAVEETSIVLNIVGQEREPANTWRRQHVNKKTHVSGLKNLLENIAAEEQKSVVPSGRKTNFRRLPDDSTIEEEEALTNPNVQPLARRRIVSDPSTNGASSAYQREYETENKSHYARQPTGLNNYLNQKTKAQHQECLVSETLDARTSDDNCWGKLVYMEKSYRCHNQMLREPLIIVDGATNVLDDSHVALGAVDNPFRDSKITKIRNHIGKGLALKVDGDGSIWATRLGINKIVLQDYRNPDTSCVSEGVELIDGHLKLGVPVKIFDMKEFKSHVILEMHAAGIKRMDMRNLCKCAILTFSFVKHVENTMMTPCWINIINTFAVRSLQDETMIKHLEKDMQKIMRSNIDFSQISQLPSFANTNLVYKPAEKSKKQKISRRDHSVAEILYAPVGEIDSTSEVPRDRMFTRQLSRPWAKLLHNK